MADQFTQRFPDVPFNEAPYTPMASPGAYPEAWFQPDMALRAAGVLPPQPMPVSNLSEMGPLRRNFPYAPGGMGMMVPGQDLMSQVLAPAGEEELRRASMLRMLGLPPAPQAVPPTFQPPQLPATAYLNISRQGGPATMTGAGAIPPAIPPAPTMAGPYAPQGYAGDIMSRINAPTYSSPMQGVGAFFSGWAGGGTQPNPVLQQLELERNNSIRQLLDLQQQWQINEGQVATAQQKKTEFALKSQELAQNQSAKRGDLIKDIAGQFWGKAETPEQREFAANMSLRAAEVAGVPLDKAITDSWKTGASTPEKNAHALGEVLSGSPLSYVSANTGVPVDTLRALEATYKRAQAGDTNAAQAIRYSTGKDPQEAAKLAGEIRAQGEALARSELEKLNILMAGPGGLDTDFKGLVMKHGGWAAAANDPKLMRAIVDEYFIKQDQQKMLAAGMANIGPEAAKEIQLRGEQANAAVDLLRQVQKNPQLVETYAGAAGVMGWREWAAQKFAGQKPTEDQYKLAAMDYAANVVKAIGTRLLAGAALGPKEAVLYEEVFPNFATMNAAQFRIATKYLAELTPILYEQYVEMQSLGAKQAMANGTFSQFKLGVARKHPLPSISKVQEELSAAGQMQLPPGLKRRSP